ncbi:MAG TPA: caspase family protein, partial [Pyrinomonadaceae bacterium]
MVYLKDRQATTRQVRTAFKDLLSQAREGDMLFVYYTGHGYKSDDERTTFFATYDAGEKVPGWATSSIVRDIERYFKGSEAVLTADCCYSGSLAQQVRALNSRISYACLASSSANELSTGNWTFTEMLLAGLKGEAYADTNQDGEITLQELAEDIRADMAFAEDQRSAFAATGVFTNQTVLARAERRSSRDVSKRVEVKSEGDWYKARIIEAGQGQYKVHYYGYDDWYDEWVNARQVRDGKVARYAPGSAVGASSRNGPWPGSPR